MKWLLLAFLGTTGVVIVASCVLALLVRGRLRRRHRVDPKVATGAPITWLADPRPAARLHRRLARVGRLASGVADAHQPSKKRGRRAADAPPIVEVATSLRAQAVALDGQLARAALLAPGPRREVLRRLERAVAELERAGQELTALSTEVLAPPVLAWEAEGVLDLAGQVERLAAAHRQLLELDQRNGLVPDPTLVAPAADAPTVVAPAPQATAAGR